MRSPTRQQRRQQLIKQYILSRRTMLALIGVRFVQLKPAREDGWQWLSNPILGRVRTFILNQ